MSKRRRCRASKGPSLLARALIRIEAISGWRVLRGVGNLILLAGLGVGGAYGLPQLERYVSRLPEYQHPLRAELVDLPAWLQGNPHVADRIVESAALEKKDRRLDRMLASRLGQRIAANGWVKQVRQVSIGADDVIRIGCDYREPVAWVAHGSFFYLVDRDRVRLPGRYTRDELSRDGGLLTIAGVDKPPPAEGKPWSGADLQAGVKMVRLLRDRPYYNQLTEVVVENYGGRRDRHRSHIQIGTDNGGRVLWGRAPGEEIDEPNADQKLAHLQGIWREYRRVDMGRPWVDIQVWPDRVIVPVCTWQESIRQRS
jgi:hypothetical protein